MSKRISKMNIAKEICRADKYLTEVSLNAKFYTVALRTVNEQIVKNRFTKGGIINKLSLKLSKTLYLRDYTKQVHLLSKAIEVKNTLENNIKILESADSNAEVFGIIFEFQPIVDEYVNDAKGILEKLNQKVLECHDLLANKFKVELDKYIKYVEDELN